MEKQKADTSFIQKTKNRKLLPLYAGLGFLLIILAVFAVIIVSDKQKTEEKASGEVVFQIEGKQYFKNETLAYTRYLTEIKGLSHDDALSQAFDLRKQLALIAKLGLNPTDEEVELAKNGLVDEEIKKLPEYSEKYDGWFADLARVSAANRYIGGSFAPAYKGYIFALRSADENYARQKGNEFIQQLKANSTSPEKVFEAINSDQKISPRGEIIGKFGSDEIKTWEEEISQSQIKEYIKSLKSTGVSALQTLPQSNENSAYIYFVWLKEVGAANVVSVKDYEDAEKALDAKHFNFKLSSDNSGELENTSEAKTNE